MFIYHSCLVLPSYLSFLSWDILGLPQISRDFPTRPHGKSQVCCVPGLPHQLGISRDFPTRPHTQVPGLLCPISTWDILGLPQISGGLPGLLCPISTWDIPGLPHQTYVHIHRPSLVPRPSRAPTLNRVLVSGCAESG